MHCECCNELLTDMETRIKFSNSGTFANTCLACLSTMDVSYKLPRNEYDEEEDEVFGYVEEDPPLYDDGELWDER